ncbi:OsmC family protein [Heyndrickxia oleronia]|uniref:OsmC family protein n=1 Tax=Heyndrickxia oleronia TaxID=38875 RepID=A0AAW6SUY2_9BACI|nr:OsmC family protein [Heyndrickxia oleronia]MCM3238925.1 OsmC family protein [Heyndrickxia oleronia]MDH5160672.1 OsmC family protein [Heyndrickxia oleronia]
MNFTIENEKITGLLKFGNIPISPNDEQGFRPYELLISSLVGCSGTLLSNILQKKRIATRKIEIKVDSVRNPAKANRIEQISIKANVFSNKGLTEQQSNKLSELVIGNCGMIQSVLGSIDITLEITFSTEFKQ